ncbi:glucose-6-phosphate isomerase [Anaeromyxobacter diazotrophicus]|uniref:Glucose-6-phosphate isomerase n=1 Tax=Anaeromyxobacter diazotrophicus TaxID=2590199 RepID=A0A7I9VM48_9BACT|nr:glucose-6-phosphate isomerase [Anaeromyxobacter diazotrophicus]GEJ57476.1 glucose-6-phosphate isomerase [Anaeromyxobacter diazotrophicus]
MAASAAWQRYGELLCGVPEVGLTVDPSRMGYDGAFVERTAPALARAFEAMDALEAGALANPDEGRRVGHYWLRDPARAPTPELRREIEEAARRVQAFAADVHAGRLRPPAGGRFTDLLCVGIGGSALGPMFVADALGDPARDPLRPHFLDNTDPDGFARVLGAIGPRLGQTLVVVTSKSGGTPETRNGMLAARAALDAVGLALGPQAVAITQAGSPMDELARREGWLARFPMWDWVGGRTSETSAVGLLPAALQGLDVEGLLEGARRCDEATRVHDPRRNPAAALALSWLFATGGKGGAKAMVVLPYKDRLLLFSRYLQQLVMESLGKRLDLAGRRVDQGLTVYGNKGSTDQHAYVQQLRDGADDFFAVFVRVLESGGAPAEVEPGVTAGDYLHGFLLGTRAALAEGGRGSVTITVRRVDARSVGALVALFERAVGLYASMVGVNAYHQPGVEAGKKAAAAVLALQARVVGALGPTPRTSEELAAALGEPEVETVHLLLEHLAANGRARSEGEGIGARFSAG